MLARPLDLLVEHEYRYRRVGPDQLGHPDRGGQRDRRARSNPSHRGPVGLWVLRVLGEYEVQQRRRFVRVPAQGPVRIAVVDPDFDPAAPALSGRLVQVSEASVSCSLAPVRELVIAPDTEVMVSFEIARQVFDLDSTVMRAKPSARRRDALDVVLLFRINEEAAAVLRRLIFAEQLRIRNLTPG